MAGIISADALQARLADPTLRMLDCRSSFAVYEEGHLPGGQFLHIETLRMTEDGVPCKMHRHDVLGCIFGQLGIDAGTPVVVYTLDAGDQLSATYTAWSLWVTGHQEVLVLDGGLRGWQADDRPVAREYPIIHEAQYPVSFQSDAFADWRYVRDRLDQPDVVLVDSRTREGYIGLAGSTMRRGHIPGAVLHNFLWDFTARGYYRPLDELRQRYEKAGITPDKEIITYCETGREGSANWFVLRCLLGYPRVRLYQASLTEWAAHPELPMVTGPASEEQQEAA